MSEYVLWILYCVPSPYIGGLEFTTMSYLEPTLPENIRVFLRFSVTVWTPSPSRKVQLPSTRSGEGTRITPHSTPSSNITGCHKCAERPTVHSRPWSFSKSCHPGPVTGCHACSLAEVARHPRGASSLSVTPAPGIYTLLTLEGTRHTCGARPCRWAKYSCT